jgi:hypothetical protein
MAFPSTVTYTFGTLTGAVPLSYLDTNFTNLTTFINGIGSGTNALTTPVLGTPTSGSLTNCTGYTAANLSGTLAITKGGTGQITANAAINALLPSQATFSGRVLTTDGTNTSWAVNGSGTVTSVAQSFTGGLISVAGSPITSSGTLALTVAGTSGGIPYFSGASTWASSAVLASNALMVGGGAGVAPSTVTTGAGVVTALGIAANSGAGGLVTNTGTATLTNKTLTSPVISGGTINNATIGATTASTGAFTSITATSKDNAGVFAINAGLTANTTVTNQATFTTAGLTLASQTAAAGSLWRVTAFGQFTAASSATARTAQIACFWGTTQLTAITPSVLISTAQTTQWQAEFILTATSTTAIWTTGTLTSRVASATALALDNATPASTTVTAGAQTLDLRVRVSTAVAAESWIIQQVTIERLE